MEKKVLCFDIGGTSIKYGVAAEQLGELQFFDCGESPTDAKTQKGPGIEGRILEWTGQWKERYPLEGVAISTAGMVDWRTGEIVYANDNIPAYAGINMAQSVERMYGLPCAVENDVNCAALGEAVYGAGRGADSIVCLTVGTGVGGAVILEQRLWHGCTGSAGEVGYMPLRGASLESGASVTALLDRVESRLGCRLDGKQVFSKAKEGHKICMEEIEGLCEALAEGIACCVCLLNPEMVVLGGGIMAQEAYLRPVLEKKLRGCLPPQLGESVRLSFAQLGNRAGMAGAFHHFQLRQQNR